MELKTELEQLNDALRDADAKITAAEADRDEALEAFEEMHNASARFAEQADAAMAKFTSLLEYAKHKPKCRSMSAGHAIHNKMLVLKGEKPIHDLTCDCGFEELKAAEAK